MESEIQAVRAAIREFHHHLEGKNIIVLCNNDEEMDQHIRAKREGNKWGRRQTRELANLNYTKAPPTTSTDPKDEEKDTTDQKEHRPRDTAQIVETPRDMKPP